MSTVSHFRTLVKGGAIAFAGNGLTYALAFIFQLILVRLLGTEGYGIWGFASTLVLTIAQFSTLGLSFAAIYFVSRGGEAAAGPGATDAARTSIFLSAAVALSAMLLLPAAARLWIVPAYHFEGLGRLLTILSAVIPLVAFVTIAESLFRAHQDAAAAFKMKLVPEALKLILIPAAVLCCGADLAVVGAAMVAVLLAPALYGGYMLNKLVVPLRTVWPPADMGRFAAPMFKYSLPFFLLEVFQMLRDRADTFIIGYISTAHYLGVYKGAYVLAALISFVPNAAAYLLFPLMSRIVHDHGIDEVEEFGRRTIKLLVYSGVPVVVGVVLFARQLMTKALGADFISGERALLLLALSSGTVIFQTFYANVLASKKRMHLLLLSGGLAFALNFGLNILLIPGYGITGAAAASLAGSVLLTLLLARFSVPALGRFVFPPGIAGALFAALCFVAAAYVLRERSVEVSAALCGLFAAFWAAWLLLFERAEVDRALESLSAFIVNRRRG